MKYGKPILALLSFWILICAKHKSSKEIADCYMFIVIDVRCFRIQTSGFTSWLHDVLHCLVFKEHPRFPPARCAFRESASIYYLIRFGLSRIFEFIFASSQRRRDSAVGDSCARGCLPPTCNILHGSMLSVKEFFQKQFKNPNYFLSTGIMISAPVTITYPTPMARVTYSPVLTRSGFRAPVFCPTNVVIALLKLMTGRMLKPSSLE